MPPSREAVPESGDMYLRYGDMIFLTPYEEVKRDSSEDDHMFLCRLRGDSKDRIVCRRRPRHFEESCLWVLTSPFKKLHTECKYGDEVRFIHRHSRKYLSILSDTIGDDEDEGEGGSLEVGLGLDESISRFQLMPPGNQFMNPGDKILRGGYMWIKALDAQNFNCFLSAEDNTSSMDAKNTMTPLKRIQSLGSNAELSLPPLSKTVRISSFYDKAFADASSFQTRSAPPSPTMRDQDEEEVFDLRTAMPDTTERNESAPLWRAKLFRRENDEGDHLQGGSVVQFLHMGSDVVYVLSPGVHKNQGKLGNENDESKKANMRRIIEGGGLAWGSSLELEQEKGELIREASILSVAGGFSSKDEKIVEGDDMISEGAQAIEGAGQKRWKISLQMEKKRRMKGKNDKAISNVWSLWQIENKQNWADGTCLQWTTLPSVDAPWPESEDEEQKLGLDSCMVAECLLRNKLTGLYLTVKQETGMTQSPRLSFEAAEWGLACEREKAAIFRLSKQGGGIKEDEEETVVRDRSWIFLSVKLNSNWYWVSQTSIRTRVRAMRAMELLDTKKFEKPWRDVFEVRMIADRSLEEFYNIWYPQEKMIKLNNTYFHKNPPSLFQKLQIDQNERDLLQGNTAATKKFVSDLQAAKNTFVNLAVDCTDDPTNRDRIGSRRGRAIKSHQQLMAQMHVIEFSNDLLEHAQMLRSKLSLEVLKTSLKAPRNSDFYHKDLVEAVQLVVQTGVRTHTSTILVDACKCLLIKALSAPISTSKTTGHPKGEESPRTVRERNISQGSLAPSPSPKLLSEISNPMAVKTTIDSKYRKDLTKVVMLVQRAGLCGTEGALLSPEESSPSGADMRRSLFGEEVPKDLVQLYIRAMGILWGLQAPGLGDFKEVKKKTPSESESEEDRARRMKERKNIRKSISGLEGLLITMLQFYKLAMWGNETLKLQIAHMRSSTDSRKITLLEYTWEWLMVEGNSKVAKALMYMLRYTYKDCPKLLRSATEEDDGQVGWVTEMKRLFQRNFSMIWSSAADFIAVFCEDHGKPIEENQNTLFDIFFSVKSSLVKSGFARLVPKITIDPDDKEVGCRIKIGTPFKQEASRKIKYLKYMHKNILAEKAKVKVVHEAKTSSLNETVSIISLSESTAFRDWYPIESDYDKNKTEYDKAVKASKVALTYFRGCLWLVRGIAIGNPRTTMALRILLRPEELVDLHRACDGMMALPFQSNKSVFRNDGLTFNRMATLESGLGPYYRGRTAVLDTDWTVSTLRLKRNVVEAFRVLYVEPALSRLASLTERRHMKMETMERKDPHTPEVARMESRTNPPDIKLPPRAVGRLSSLVSPPIYSESVDEVNDEHQKFKTQESLVEIKKHVLNFLSDMNLLSFDFDAGQRKIVGKPKDVPHWRAVTKQTLLNVAKKFTDTQLKAAGDSCVNSMAPSAPLPDPVDDQNSDENSYSPSIDYLTDLYSRIQDLGALYNYLQDRFEILDEFNESSALSITKWTSVGWILAEITQTIEAFADCNEDDDDGGETSVVPLQRTQNQESFMGSMPATHIPDRKSPNKKRGESEKSYGKVREYLQEMLAAISAHIIVGKILRLAPLLSSLGPLHYKTRNTPRNSPGNSPTRRTGYENPLDVKKNEGTPSFYKPAKKRTLSVPQFDDDYSEDYDRKKIHRIITLRCLRILQFFCGVDSGSKCAQKRRPTARAQSVRNSGRMAQDLSHFLTGALRDLKRCVSITKQVEMKTKRLTKAQLSQGYDCRSEIRWAYVVTNKITGIALAICRANPEICRQFSKEHIFVLFEAYKYFRKYRCDEYRTCDSIIHLVRRIMSPDPGFELPNREAQVTVVDLLQTNGLWSKSEPLLQLLTSTDLTKFARMMVAEAAEKPMTATVAVLPDDQKALLDSRIHKRGSHSKRDSLTDKDTKKDSSSRFKAISSDRKLKFVPEKKAEEDEKKIPENQGPSMPRRARTTHFDGICITHRDGHQEWDRWRECKNNLEKLFTDSSQELSCADKDAAECYKLRCQVLATITQFLHDKDVVVRKDQTRINTLYNYWEPDANIKSDIKGEKLRFAFLRPNKNPAEFAKRDIKQPLEEANHLVVKLTDLKHSTPLWKSLVNLTMAMFRPGPGVRNSLLFPPRRAINSPVPKTQVDRIYWDDYGNLQVPGFIRADRASYLEAYQLLKLLTAAAQGKYPKAELRLQKIMSAKTLVARLEQSTKGQYSAHTTVSYSLDERKNDHKWREESVQIYRVRRASLHLLHETWIHTSNTTLKGMPQCLTQVPEHFLSQLIEVRKILFRPDFEKLLKSMHKGRTGGVVLREALLYTFSYLSPMLSRLVEIVNQTTKQGGMREIDAKKWAGVLTKLGKNMVVPKHDAPIFVKNMNLAHLNSHSYFELGEGIQSFLKHYWKGKSSNSDIRHWRLKWNELKAELVAWSNQNQPIMGSTDMKPRGRLFWSAAGGAGKNLSANYFADSFNLPKYKRFAQAIEDEGIKSIARQLDNELQNLVEIVDGEEDKNSDGSNTNTDQFQLTYGNMWLCATYTWIGFWVLVWAPVFLSFVGLAVIVFGPVGIYLLVFENSDRKSSKEKLERDTLKEGGLYCHSKKMEGKGQLFCIRCSLSHISPMLQKTDQTLTARQNHLLERLSAITDVAYGGNKRKNFVKSTHIRSDINLAEEEIKHQKNQNNQLRICNLFKSVRQLIEEEFGSNVSRILYKALIQMLKNWMDKSANTAKDMDERSFLFNRFAFFHTEVLDEGAVLRLLAANSFEFAELSIKLIRSSYNVHGHGSAVGSDACEGLFLANFLLNTGDPQIQRTFLDIMKRDSANQVLAVVRDVLHDFQQRVLMHQQESNQHELKHHSEELHMVELSLGFLFRLCMGDHKTGASEYLRDQAGERDQNLVSEVVWFTHALQKDLKLMISSQHANIRQRSTALELLRNALRVLRECCIGPTTANQNLIGTMEALYHAIFELLGLIYKWHTERDKERDERSKAKKRRRGQRRPKVGMVMTREGSTLPSNRHSILLPREKPRKNMNGRPAPKSMQNPFVRHVASTPKENKDDIPLVNIQETPADLASEIDGRGRNLSEATGVPNPKSSGSILDEKHPLHAISAKPLDDIEDDQSDVDVSSPRSYIEVPELDESVLRAKEVEELQMRQKLHDVESHVMKLLRAIMEGQNDLTRRFQANILNRDAPISADGTARPLNVVRNLLYLHTEKHREAQLEALSLGEEDPEKWPVSHLNLVLEYWSYLVMITSGHDHTLKRVREKLDGWKAQVDHWEDRNDIPEQYRMSEMLIQCEVVHRNNKLERVFFIKPWFFCIGQTMGELKDQLRNNAVVEKRRDKRITDFIDESSQLWKIAEFHNIRVPYLLKGFKTRRGILSVLQGIRSNLHKFWIITYLTVLLLNVLLIWWSKWDSVNGKTIIEFHPPESECSLQFDGHSLADGSAGNNKCLGLRFVFPILGTVHVILSVLMITSWGLSIGLIRFYQEYAAYIKGKEDDEATGLTPMAWRRAKKRRPRGKKKKTRDLNIVSLWDLGFDFWNIVRMLKLVIQIPMVNYYALYLITGILAVAHSPIWNAFHLLDIIHYHEDLKRVLLVTDKHKYRLLATIILGVIAVYAYAVLVFVFFRSNIVFNIDDDLVYDCDSLWGCVQKAIDLGFRNAPVFTEKPVPVVTPMFDLIFFLLVNTILVSIITGIIIDTFAEMRANKDEVDEEVNSRCFICRIDCEKFNKSKSHAGYGHHVTVEHNTWAYFYLVHYIRNKAEFEPEAFTGIELYVSKILASGDQNFWRIIPYKETMHIQYNRDDSLEQSEDEDE